MPFLHRITVPNRIFTCDSPTEAVDILAKSAEDLDTELLNEPEAELNVTEAELRMIVSAVRARTSPTEREDLLRKFDDAIHQLSAQRVMLELPS